MKTTLKRLEINVRHRRTYAVTVREALRQYPDIATWPQGAIYDMVEQVMGGMSQQIALMGAIDGTGIILDR